MATYTYLAEKPADISNKISKLTNRINIDLEITRILISISHDPSTNIVTIVFDGSLPDPQLETLLFMFSIIVNEKTTDEVQPPPCRNIQRQSLVATGAPTAQHDSNLNYNLGSIIVHGTDVWICADNTEDNAVWVQLNNPTELATKITHYNFSSGSNLDLGGSFIGQNKSSGIFDEVALVVPSAGQIKKLVFSIKQDLDISGFIKTIIAGSSLNIYTIKVPYTGNNYGTPNVTLTQIQLALTTYGVGVSAPNSSIVPVGTIIGTGAVMANNEHSAVSVTPTISCNERDLVAIWIRPSGLGFNDFSATATLVYETN